MKVLVLDNYDSFTFNLVHILRELGVAYEVYRNNKIELSEVDQFDKILFSPGPGIPSEAGFMPEIIENYIGQKPMLGICLGHQAIAEYMGGKLENMPKVYHGINTPIFQTGKSKIFEGIPREFEAGRYHSWKVSKEGLPAGISISAEDEDGDIMAFDVAEMNAFGIQFHPESVMTPMGKKMIQNFIELDK
jgi:anthranilate synthase component 2